MNWQPIETAPKDGTWVLLARNLNNPNWIPTIEICRWYPSDANWELTGWVNSKTEYFDNGQKPQHWTYITI